MNHESPKNDDDISDLTEQQNSDQKKLWDLEQRQVSLDCIEEGIAKYRKMALKKNIAEREIVIKIKQLLSPFWFYYLVSPDLMIKDDALLDCIIDFYSRKATVHHLLLYGSPGTGKTTYIPLLLNAIVKSINDNYRINLVDVFSIYDISSGTYDKVKKTDDQNQMVFVSDDIEDLKKQLNIVTEIGLTKFICMIINEADQYIQKRDGELKDEYTRKMLTFFEELKEYPNVMIVATTNLKIENIDSAIIREGRFCKKEFKNSSNAQKTDLLEFFKIKLKNIINKNLVENITKESERFLKIIQDREQFIFKEYINNSNKNMGALTRYFNQLRVDDVQSYESKCEN